MSKRGLAIITVIGLLVCGCNSHKQKVQEEYTELGGLEILPRISLSDFELRGDVKKISEYSYDAILRFGEYEKDESSRYLTEYLFNDKGKLTETNGYILYSTPDEPLVLRKKSKYQYDSNNLLETIETYGNSGNLIGKQVFKYDRYNNCIEMAQYRSDGSISEQRLYSYDMKSNITIDENYYHGKLLSSSKYYYDNRGRLIESTYEAANNSETDYYSTSYKYDKLNNMTEEVDYNSKGWILNKTVYRYRGNKEIEMIEFDPVDISISRTQYSKRSKVITNVEKNNESIDKQTFIYNNKHELAEINYSNGSYESSKFDKKSNWIYYLWVSKEINGDGEIMAEITEREIIYWN